MYNITHNHEKATFGFKKIALFAIAAVLMFFVLTIICVVLGFSELQFYGTYLVVLAVASGFCLFKRKSETDSRRLREKNISDKAATYLRQFAQN